METTRCRSPQLIVFAVVFLGTLHNWIVGAELTFTLPHMVDDFEKTTDHATEEFPVQHSTYSTPYKEGPEHKSSFLDPIDDHHPSSETSIADPASRVRRINTIYFSDLFSIEDRRHGWVALHVFGMIYVFVALLIVCDQFFVPSLGVIMEKLAISNDVVGASFMAAGIAVPWFITKLIQVLYYHYNLTVNINPTIGATAFKMLFVIGTCAMFSAKVLPLRCWSFFRDLSFYMLGFIQLIIFLSDSVVAWCESVILVTVFVLYITFLIYDENVEQIMKTQLQKIKGVMKASFVKKCKKVLPIEPQVCTPEGENDAQGPGDCDEECGNENNGGCNEKKFVESKLLQGATSLSLRWPDKWQERAAYIILLPIILPLWLTLPSVHNQKARKFFVLTYLVSIVWIGIFSYLERWWAHQVDETFGVMGPMTFVGALMSSSDFITSLIVARKGLGDMVVSGNLGSNILTMTLFLPVEWFLYSAIHGFSPVAISTEGLFCVSFLLFVILLAAVISIISFKWRMKKLLGLTLVLLYLIFIVISILMVFQIIICPV
ncbi:sodium/potassium/calcium exchanger 1-like isoform X1 [Poecilia latipinna]|uniref:sodium/potassium/calcium exchanger 1-like isoform X1 n=1 Tax=Poecilia latipinna TaxID=48699 RepID=UPI00072DE3B7|nr:PREDICTED: sodium/potassium/calcium exchanger 1-like isoform X1 [Poecilia latipinna]XP_014907580.1 PREDICTED: sodium/potassium/calcium exchanger 1-like isoform X1 [Poecilia latipinna]XP_014907581.1 PREDICTED: sodium/potassium/calcium exchanger 1-like isoform X1 [Poecilia latipinna]